MSKIKRLISMILALALVVGTGIPTFASEVSEDTVAQETEEMLTEPVIVSTDEPEEVTIEVHTDIVAELPTEEAVLVSDSSNAYASMSGTCGDNLTWTLDDQGTLIISGTGPMYDYEQYFYSNGNYAPWIFQGDIENVIVNYGVTTIGDYAFYDCSLTSVTVPSSVTCIGSSAFMSCSDLTDVKLSEGLREIGYDAFSGCSSLTSISIPTTLTSIAGEAFCDSGLRAVYISDLEAWCRIDFEELEYVGWASNPLSLGADLYLNGRLVTDLKIPESIKDIKDFSFVGCTSLRTVTFHSDVTSIGSGAFINCDSLEYIVFQGDAPSIEDTLYEKWSGNPSAGGEIIQYRNYGSFEDLNFVAYYPYDADWGDNKIPADRGGGQITWIAYDPTLKMPAKPYKVANVVSGVHVYWNALPGVTKYGLWRSETGKNGYYKWMGNPKTNHFTDTKVESGKSYYYCVSTCDPNTNAHSMMSAPISITYLSTPDITQRLNRLPGIQLTWNQIPGATGYRIYRKSYSGSDSWVKVGEVSGNSSLTWVDSSVKTPNGSMYKYTVRAVYNDILSGCRSAGRSMMRLTSLTLKSATKTGTGTVKLSWSTTKMADGYEIRFMNGDKIVKQFTIGNYKTGVKTFTGIPTGATYKVQVRCYKKVDGMGFYSAWSTAKNLTL